MPLISDALKWDYNAAAKSIILKFPLDVATKGVEGMIMFFRPSDAAQDLIVQINLSAEGHQVIDASSLSEGMWRFKVFGNSEEIYFYNEDILVID